VAVVAVRDRPALLFHCQHSLGLGHLARSFALGAGLAHHFRVVMLCGGKVPPAFARPAGVEVVELPALHMENNVLMTHDRRRSVARVVEQRRRVVMEVFEATAPAVVVVELFPFGRKKFASEIVPLVEAARASGAVIASSVRDVLVANRRDQADHDDRARATADELFDVVFVHTDPRFARFEDSFRPRVAMRVPIISTGFVVPSIRAATEHSPVAGQVVVSAGGGAVGAPLLLAAAGAQRLRPAVRMMLLTGPFLPDDALRSLRAAAARQPGLTVRRFLPDLASELGAASGSISQCGYNTALDVVRSRVPALFVPYAEAGEDEQARRAQRLAELGMARVLGADDLTPERLAGELDRLAVYVPAPVRLDLDGAATTTARLVDLCTTGLRAAG